MELTKYGMIQWELLAYSNNDGLCYTSDLEASLGIFNSCSLILHKSKRVKGPHGSELEPETPNHPVIAL